MRVIAAITAVAAAIAGVEATGPTCSSCVLYDIPATALCGAQGWRINTAAPWYAQLKNIADADTCIKSCVGGCKAVAFDKQYKYCNLYAHDVASFGLTGTSANIRYFDRSCSFGTSAGAVCGQTGSSTGPTYFEKPYDSKEDCQLLCKLEPQCKSARYNTANGKCTLAKAAVKDNFSAGASSTTVFYDADCYEC